MEWKPINGFEDYKVISKCCNNQLKTYKGFVWKFASE